MFSTGQNRWTEKCYDKFLYNYFKILILKLKFDKIYFALSIHFQAIKKNCKKSYFLNGSAKRGGRGVKRLAIKKRKETKKKEKKVPTNIKLEGIK